MKNQELNLLHVFSAIMTEGSITRAADRLATRLIQLPSVFQPGSISSSRR